MPDALDFSNWSCPLPLRNHPNIVMGHGGGGKLSADLIDHLFVPAFANTTLATLGDAAVLDAPGSRLAFTTDSFVVRPLFFPGGSIGDLAVNGTVNDLAMSGARPLYLTAGFILEEGLPLTTLGSIVACMAAAARAAGVTIVAGDTKVVDRGHGDGVYINTSGLGLVPPGVAVGPDRARPGAVVLVSGTLGDHGVAIMSVRAGIEFETVIMSDCAPLADLVGTLFAASPEIHVLRDPTRGGLASSLNEIARSSQVGILLEERAIPVRPEVSAACEFLGLDPLYVANEGKLIAIVAPAAADAVLAALRRHPLGRDAARIGHVTADYPGRVAAATPLGATRLVDLPIGELLPRIC